MRTHPGQMALHVTPVPAVSNATTLVSPTSPNLLVQYAALNGEATNPWAEDMLTTRPQPKTSKAYLLYLQQ